MGLICYPELEKENSEKEVARFQILKIIWIEVKINDHQEELNLKEIIGILKKQEKTELGKKLILSIVHQEEIRAVDTSALMTLTTITLDS